MEIIEMLDEGVLKGRVNRHYLIPGYEYYGQEAWLFYTCLGCGKEYDINKLLYTCPDCGSILLITDYNFGRLKEFGPRWRDIFNERKSLNIPALKGIYLFHEFTGPSIPLDCVVWLGEANTPMIPANKMLTKAIGIKFFIKNDGQNPSGSFKDRGMASAFSFIKTLLYSGKVDEVLAICASTGDTSASEALYAANMAGDFEDKIKSAVLLPHGKVTPQQLSQPLGNGAAVFEIPGVFDDCMKIVEALAGNYNVALLNSKNAWRILGQESYAYEISQDFDYDLMNKVVVIPIGNAGNITAVLNGFLKFFKAGVISELPKIIGVQSEHADPVYQFYLEDDNLGREFQPTNVKPSVAQAAMIGNPVSMPRVRYLVERYNNLAEQKRVFFLNVPEQEIMDSQIMTNSQGNIVCTHGGECVAGLARAVKLKLVDPEKEIAVVDSTAHALKFSGFQSLYFNGGLPAEFGIKPNQDLVNIPRYVHPNDLKKIPSQEQPLEGRDLDRFIERTSEEVAKMLDLEKK